MIKRDDCIRLLAAHHTDEIVVPLYQAAFEWYAIKPWPLTYYAFGAMGQGSSHGLGFAIGVPERRVWVLDGDGSLLMNLGSIVTIANAAPKNLVHCVCENGTYETNGAVPIPHRGGFTFTGLAREAGYARTCTFDDVGEWDRSLDALLREDGPVMVDLKVEPGEDYPENFRRLYDTEHRDRFRRALAES